MSFNRSLRALAVLAGAILLSAGPAAAQLPQQGPKLVGAGASGLAEFGYSLALSADGNTAIVGARYDSNFTGAAWVFTRNAGVWTQQGPKLVAPDASPGTMQAVSVSLSADGNTAIIGGDTSSSVGAAWIWTRSDGVWTQAATLVGSGAVGNAGQGNSVALSGDGNTAIVGGFADNGGAGAVWIFTRSGAAWTQQGEKLVGSGGVGSLVQQGYSVALSSDGSTAIVGSFSDNNIKGAAWIWTRSAGLWSQQGPKLVASNSSPFAGQGKSVALSSDGNTAVVGGYGDGNGPGAAWIWTRNNVTWTQGTKLVPPAASTSAQLGWSVSLAADGNTALIGAPGDNAPFGAAWVWARSGSVWTRQASPLAGTDAVGSSNQGSAVALSADGATAMVGGVGDSVNSGAAWVFSSVTTPVPTFSLDKSSLLFRAVGSGGSFSAQTSAQTVRLTQTGAGTAAWTAASNVPWLVVSPASGSGSAALTISTQFAPGLAASQAGAITLTPASPNTTGPIHISATLGVLTPSAAAAPFGSFDTPLDGTTGVTGSIAVTGWALDDVEVVRVRIWRDPVAGEPAGALIFVGDAVLVDGARPDVRGLFPSAPRSSRAGWGYLMLTNFLPALGNGTFTLYAVADDADGHTVTLGSKTITCTNSLATEPTGAIDTPIQGGVVSGNVTNFGWVISPNPRRADPPNGGTVRVLIDGAFISAVPTGWTSRPDLSALFPVDQYPGIGTALGVAAFDSTTLANGVHTIAWLVTDNQGSTSGIGSRYFSVANGSLMLGSSEQPVSAAASLARVVPAPAVTALRGRRGFDPDRPFQIYSPRDGRVTVQAEELDRIELQLGDAGGHPFAGYLRSNDGLAPLPVGSVLDPATGTFTWMPGVGFTGAYDLVFVQPAGGDAAPRRDVRVVLNPKGSNRVGPQTVIDAAPAVAGSSFVVAGWAADLDAGSDRGVDAVHVWAYPVDRGSAADPIWLGAAAYGGARPDVAAIFGERFLRTGYGLTVQGLAPGTYDVAVFAYSTLLGEFAPAKTARVVVR